MDLPDVSVHRPAPRRGMAVGVFVLAGLSILLTSCQGGQGAGEPAAPNSSAPVASATSEPSLPGGGPSTSKGATTAASATPAPLHISVDDWPTGTVVVDTGDRQLPVGVRIADTGPRRSHGLMEVPDVPDGTGMWFAYDSDATGDYWMKGTLTDLDIAWVDSAGTVVGIETMQVCEASPCPTWGPDTAYRAALEVRAGWLAANDVTVGDTMRLHESSP